MKKLIAFLPMYACYYFGELCFQIVDRWPGEWSDEETVFDKIVMLFYHGYQRGMSLSVDLNDWAGFQFWRSYGDKHDEQ